MNTVLLNDRPYTKNPQMEGFYEGQFKTKDGVMLRVLHKGEGMPLTIWPLVLRWHSRTF